MPSVELPQGTVHYRDTAGERGVDAGAPVVVLVHGLLVNGSLWSRVVPRLAGCRVLVPDLPLGSHRTPMCADADLGPAGLGGVVADFLAALELTGVTLVGNDTGGAICQLTAADHPERIGGLVLTNCDAYRDFPPLAFRWLQLVPRIPGAVRLMSALAPLAPVRAIFNTLTTDPIPDELYSDWIRYLRVDAGVRRDVAKVLRGVTSRETMRAIAVLRGFDRPTLIVWGRRDRFFKPALAERLAADIPGARLEWLPGARTFTPLDAPERLARLIAEFAGPAAPAGPAAHADPAAPTQR